MNPNNYSLTHKKYTLNEIKQGDGSGAWYLIPKEISEYHEPYYVSRRKIKDKLKKLGWTLQEYYDVFILNINNPCNRPKCKYCGTYIPIGRGTLSSMYQKSANYSFGVISEFCCHSCETSYVYEHPEIYPEAHESWNKFYESGGSFRLIFDHPEDYPEFHKKFWEYIEENSKNGGAFGRAWKDPDQAKYLQECITKWNKETGGVIENIWRNPDKYPEAYRRLTEFYNSGGAFQYMYSHPDEYPDFKPSFNNTYHGEFRSTKTRRIAWYQSSWEEIYFHYLDLNEDVLDWDAQPFYIEYYNSYYGWNKKYRPDAVVIYSDRTELIEIKPKCFVNNPIVQDKAEAAKEYCKLNNMIYKIITEDDLHKLGLL